MEHQPEFFLASALLGLGGLVYYLRPKIKQGQVPEDVVLYILKSKEHEYSPYSIMSEAMLRWADIPFKKEGISFLDIKPTYEKFSKTTTFTVPSISFGSEHIVDSMEIAKWANAHRRGSRLPLSLDLTPGLTTLLQVVGGKVFALNKPKIYQSLDEKNRTYFAQKFMDSKEPAATPDELILISKKLETAMSAPHSFLNGTFSYADVALWSLFKALSVFTPDVHQQIFKENAKLDSWRQAVENEINWE